MSRSVLKALTLSAWFAWMLVGQAPLVVADDSSSRALTKAADGLRQGNFSSALSEADKAAMDQSLKPWALLLRGQILEKQQKPADAEAVYRLIGEESAASLDARTALLRLKLRDPYGKLGVEAGSLEQELGLADRSDLGDELTLIKARYAEDHGDRESALNLYQSVRKRKGGLGIGGDARDSVWRLQRELEASKPPSAPELMAETALLLKEHEGARALEKIRKAKALIPKGSAQYYEALLVEDQAQREFGNSAEANKLLEQVVKDGDPGNASQALTRIIKGAWNKDDDATIRSRIAEFRDRFGTQNSSEVSYIEGRSLEHSGEHKRAEAAYKKLADSNGALEFRVKAIRQLAWNAYREKEFQDAAHYFAQGFELTKRSLDDVASKTIEAYRSNESFGPELESAARARVKSARDLLDDKLHMEYWLGDSLANLSAGARKQVFASPPEALWQQVVDEAPFSYYGGLSRKRLGGVAVSIPKAGQCLQETPSSLVAVLSALESAGLPDFAEAEINWRLTKVLSLAERTALRPPLSGAKQFKQQQLAFLLTRAKLFLTYAHPNQGVVLADQIFKRPSALKPFAFDVGPCMGTLRSLAFPVPMEQAFRARAQENNVSPALMLAITRTESLFDPRARSAKDARGLMQMLPSTAQQEGMKSGENLFDPETNIHYAAKHLARLLGKFQNNPALVAASYNAGAAATENWLAAYPADNVEAWAETITYPETRDYVKKVMLAKGVYEGILSGK